MNLEHVDWFSNLQFILTNNLPGSINERLNLGHINLFRPGRFKICWLLLLNQWKLIGKFPVGQKKYIKKTNRNMSGVTLLLLSYWTRILRLKLNVCYILILFKWQIIGSEEIGPNTNAETGFSSRYGLMHIPMSQQAFLGSPPDRQHLYIEC